MSQRYLFDRALVPRVQKYLEANLDKSFIEISVMADELQTTYREYTNRKRSAFRASVSKAYAIVLDSYRDRNTTSNEDTPESEDSNLDNNTEVPQNNTTGNNSMNNQLLGLYNRKTVLRNMEESELIDISSDDSQDSAQRTAVPHQKKARGGGGGGEPAYEKVPYDPRMESLRNFQERMEEYQDNDRGKKRKLEVPPNQPLMKALIKRKRSLTLPTDYDRPNFNNIGGMDKTLEDVCKLLLHISHPEIYRTLGITPPRGFLLHGPPGCGKTLLANAIAGELGVPLLKVAAPELVAGFSGGSEERIRDLFQEAVEISPCVLFIDEIDAITPNRQNAQKDMEKRIVAQLLSCLDELNTNELANRILVIGATNRPDSIDPALRRAGRFDREICLGIPDKDSRAAILKVLTVKLKLADSFDFDVIAGYTPGYVGADLLALTREAVMAAVNRLLQKIKEKHQNSQPPSKQLQQQQSQQQQQSSDNGARPQAVDVSAEVISDEETPKEVESVNGNAETDVLVIDDDAKAAAAAAAKAASGAPTDKIQKVVDGASEGAVAVAVAGEPSKKLTSLDHMLLWLHDKFPLSEEELKGLYIEMEDFRVALGNVQPSAKREGFATVPNTTWDDVGSLKEIREELQLSIVAPVRHSAQFEALGITVPAGVLLCGPPGCGKTLLAKAIANEAGINFISVKGPELLNMYVGESERAVRVCFERARNSSPCVIFFDELDSLCPKRSSSAENSPTQRVVNQLLTEMDGIGSRKGVFVLAASNRPDIIDPAILRPGRLDKILFVGLPSANDKTDILRAITKNGTSPKLASDVDLEWIATSEECTGYTGADIAALVREAGVLALKDVLHAQNLNDTPAVSLEHFKRAFSKIRPSVPEKERVHYEKLRKVYSSLRKDREEEDMELS